VANDQLETELKIPVSDLGSVRQALARQAATQIHPMAREVNILLDDDGGHLQRAGSILRLRTYGEQHMLTFKGPARYHGKIKQRPEYEVSCGDAGRLLEVLEHLGFSAAARYEKHRETWLLGGMEVVLDHTPMGDYVEIEGPPESLDSTAASLDLDPEEAVRGSYLSLWSEYRQRHRGKDLPADMVFSK
jgi:adenylate cyclase class 2